MCAFFFFKQKTAYEMRISDWSSDVCSSDLDGQMGGLGDLATTTEGDPIDGHDHRLGKGFEARRHRLAAPHKVPHRYVPALPHAPGKFREIGRASCRERVCQYV